VLRLFPIASIASAALVPLITVLYAYDIDVYEDEPLSPLDLGTLGEPKHSVPVRGFLVPGGGLLLMLLGPLVLLPYRRFNDVLDGVTFGVTFGVSSAVSYMGSLVIVTSLDYLGNGLRPVGLVGPWIAWVLTFGLALLLLAAAVAGSAAGAFWLRYRAPVADRARLGLLGRPVIATLAAAAALIAAAVAQLDLSPFAALGVIAALDLVGLSWLRQLMHLGLIEEAAEAAVGPSIGCANCGNSTRRQTFCSQCGIALSALPKGYAAQCAPAEEPLRGEA
jgi:hypothetical protein